MQSVSFAYEGLVGWQVVWEGTRRSAVTVAPNSLLQQSCRIPLPYDDESA